MRLVVKREDRMKKLIVVLVMLAVVLLPPAFGSVRIFNGNGNGNAPGGGGLSWEVQQQLINALLLQIQAEERRHAARLAFLEQFVGAPARRPVGGPIADENARHDYIMSRLLARLAALGWEPGGPVD